MNLNRNKIPAIAGLLCLMIVFAYWFYSKETVYEQAIDSDYIFDKSRKITLEDVKKSRLPFPRIQEDFQDKEAGTIENSSETALDNIDVRALFSEALINSYTTVNYFKHLESRFKNSVNLGEHLQQVKDYLFSEFYASEAEKLYETYQKYVECEISLAEEFRNFGLVRTPEDAIAILQQIHDHRRLSLGEELADLLFGADVKAKEYAFRRAVIVRDVTLYGSEKEVRIGKLNEDMWGEEAHAVESHPNAYTRYQEKLNIYEKDFSELSSEETQKKIREFREQFFPPDAVARLEEVDRQIAREQMQEDIYRKKEAMLTGDPNLSDTEREIILQKLQDELFGEEAEAFRRGETMRTEREKLMKEYEGKGLQAR
jgi:lipase chaperone LimK